MSNRPYSLCHIFWRRAYCIFDLTLYKLLTYLLSLPSVLWRCEGYPACKKWVVGWWHGVICLQRDADLHMVQPMPLPFTVSCCSKIQIGFTFLVPAHLGSPGQRAVKRVCVCVCVLTYLVTYWLIQTQWTQLRCHRPWTVAAEGGVFPAAGRLVQSLPGDSPSWSDAVIQRRALHRTSEPGRRVNNNMMSTSYSHQY